MLNVNYLFDCNPGTIKLAHLTSNNSIEYISNVKLFDFNELKKIILFFNSVEKKYGNISFLKIRIIYNNNIRISDKLTYILFECLLYEQIINKSRKIELKMPKIQNIIFTDGIFNSCLKDIYNVEEFKKNFPSVFTLNHYRKLVYYEEYKKDLQIVSFIFDEIRYFLKNCEVNEQNSINIAEVTTELIDNALNHTQTDCLVDVNVSIENKINALAVSIAVVNFSNNLLGGKIDQVLNDKKESNESFKKLQKIKNKHKEYFDAFYSLEDFYIISAFQNKITTRQESTYSGGKGLTRLIESLQQAANLDICYVVSGNRCLFFLKDQIKQDNDKWVGFNIENNCQLKPNVDALKTSPININGTAYNLTFIFKKESVA